MNWSGLKTRAKIQFAVVIGAALAMQVPEVKNQVMPLIANHPHLSSIMAGVFSVIQLLQNPCIEKMLGLDSLNEEGK